MTYIGKCTIYKVDSLKNTNYLRETLDESTLSFSSRKLPANSVWMEHLKLKNVLVCNPESRNIHNKIFGGWLMRQAFELGK